MSNNNEKTLEEKMQEGEQLESSEEIPFGIDLNEAQIQHLRQNLMQNNNQQNQHVNEGPNNQDLPQSYSAYGSESHIQLPPREADGEMSDDHSFPSVMQAHSQVEEMQVHSVHSVDSGHSIIQLPPQEDAGAQNFQQATLNTNHINKAKIQGLIPGK